MGGEPKARSTMWPCAFGSAQTCLIELIRPALPPLGTAGQGGRYRGYTARCAAGWVGPAWAAWPAVRPVAHSVRHELAYPHATPLDGVEVPRASTSSLIR